MNAMLLLAWWNLIYIVPFGLALVYLGLYVFTGLSFGEADLDADADCHVDADAEGDFDHDVHGDADGDHDASLDADAHTSATMAALSLLGVGKIPLSLALLFLLLLWGFFGFVLNQLLVQMVGATWIVGAISVPMTAAVSLALTALLAQTMAKVMPTNETYARRRSALVGRVGEALFPIDSAFGMAAVRDEQGDLFQVQCRTGEGKASIEKGTRVVLFDYDAEKALFYAAPIAGER